MQSGELPKSQPQVPIQTADSCQWLLDWKPYLATQPAVKLLNLLAKPE
jgi:hypothetical protein